MDSVGVTATRNRENGQATVEWLMLMAVTFSFAYLVVNVPLGRTSLSGYTAEYLINIRLVLANVVQNAEWVPGAPLTYDMSRHPGNPRRLRPLH